jgi:ABC-type sulfate/molybdate transport systems ATPase subunit
MRAVVVRIHAAGPSVKVELAAETGESMLVEMAHDRYRALGLKAHDEVFVSPRESKVFYEDYSI